LCVLGLAALSAGSPAEGSQSGGAPATASPSTGAAILTWEKAFSLQQAPANVHFVARFSGQDGVRHRLEVWRYGRDFLRRKTDDALDLYVAARAKDPGEYDYRFVDHRRHMVTDVQRSNLYRVGVFSDWFGLAHVLDRPRSAFALTPASAPAAEGPRDTVGAGQRSCVWRELRVAPVAGQAGAEARICWSNRWALPLAIYQHLADGSWGETVAIEEVGDARVTQEARRLPPPPPSYGHIDANDQIAPQHGRED